MHVYPNYKYTFACIDIFEYELRYYIPQDQSNLSLDEGIQASRVIAAKVHELGVLPLICSLLCASPIFIVQQHAATALGNLTQVVSAYNAAHTCIYIYIHKCIHMSHICAHMHI